MCAIDGRVVNKILIIKGILAEKCGLLPELYEELCSELDDILVIIGKNESDGNPVASTDSKLNLADVSNLAKFSKKIAAQKDCPSEFVDIVNKEFWNLI